MDDFDLEIEHYGLDDLLGLFRINAKLTAESVKSAHRTALMMHPDKSSLPSEYYIFFMKAYKIISNVYEFQHRKNTCSRATVYHAEVDEGNAEYLRALDGKSIGEFNKWFNEMFEKVRIKDGESDTGYGNWMNDMSKLEANPSVPLSEFATAFEKKKKECKAIAVHKGISEMEAPGGYNIAREELGNYSSSMFSKLQYEDLKKAHTETVVPVTMEDYHSKTKFSSVDSYKRHRQQQDTEPLSLTQARRYLAERSDRDSEMSTRRAYSIFKREEEIAKGNSAWWSHLKQLTNE